MDYEVRNIICLMSRSIVLFGVDRNPNMPLSLMTCADLRTGSDVSPS